MACNSVGMQGMYNCTYKHVTAATTTPEHSALLSSKSELCSWDGLSLAYFKVAMPGCPVQRTAPAFQSLLAGSAATCIHRLNRRATLLHKEPAHGEMPPSSSPQQRSGPVPVLLLWTPPLSVHLSKYGLISTSSSFKRW